MARSSKKGPFVDPKLIKKVDRLNEGGQKKPIKTWCRRSDISPDFVGHTFAVHNGKQYIELFKKRKGDTLEPFIDLDWFNTNIYSRYISVCRR